MRSSSGEVWTTVSEALSAYVGRRVNDEHAAADILQETFIRIHGGIDDLRDDDRLLPWVYRVARSAIADYFRRVRPTVPLGPGAEADPTGGTGGAGRADDADGNHNATVGRWLVEMIGALPPPYRAAVQHAEIDGLTQREVADRLGLSLSGAKSRVQRGRALLREALLDCCHIELDRRGNVVDYAPNRCCATCGDRGAGDREGEGKENGSAGGAGPAGEALGDRGEP